jgi:hypothetical protein
VQPVYFLGCCIYEGVWLTHELHAATQLAVLLGKCTRHGDEAGPVDRHLNTLERQHSKSGCSQAQKSACSLLVANPTVVVTDTSTCKATQTTQNSKSQTERGQITSNINEQAIQVRRSQLKLQRPKPSSVQLFQVCLLYVSLPSPGWRRS